SSPLVEEVVELLNVVIANSWTCVVWVVEQWVVRAYFCKGEHLVRDTLITELVLMIELEVSLPADLVVSTPTDEGTELPSGVTVRAYHTVAWVDLVAFLVEVEFGLVVVPATAVELRVASVNVVRPTTLECC